MDEMLLNAKVDSLLRCLERIKARLPKTRMEFEQDFDAQDVVILNITRAVQLCVDMTMHILSDYPQIHPVSMAQSFDELQKLQLISPTLADKMRRSVGYRNVAVHNYGAVDLGITYAIAQSHLEDFVQFVREIKAI